MWPAGDRVKVPGMYKSRSLKKQVARERGGFSPAVLFTLAVLGVPRVVLHDLGIIQEGSVLNSVLVFLPPAVWVLVAVVARVSKPFVSLLAVGAVYGVLLVVVHQLLWGVSFDGNPPSLGGNLADLDPMWQNVILRLASVPSGLFTGVLVGACSGAVAWGISAVGLRRPGNPETR